MARLVRTHPWVALVVPLVLGLGACADDGPAATDPPTTPEVTTARDTTNTPDTTAPPGTSAASDTTAPSETTAVPDAPGAPVETVGVQTLDNSFRPEVLEIVAGTEVVWTNDGRNEHDVTPADATPAEVADGATTWGVGAVDFGPGAEYRHVFTEPGEYPYYCSIHGTPDAGQIGTIIVTT